MTDALRDAVDAMRQVRDRCVWSQRISHRDLVPYLIEEAAETVDAVEAGSAAELREELGDLLWQVLFHAEIAHREPENGFDIDDVARGLTEKMVRRHPHVFGDAVAETPEQVLVLWNAAKAAEKHERRSVLDGVSHRMPSLALAQKLLSRAAALPSGAVSQQRIAETAVYTRSLGAPVPSHDRAPVVPADEAELGDALLALVALARAQGWDAERALRERLRRLEVEIRDAEAGGEG